MSDSLWPHRLQHVGLLCPSLSPRVCLNSCLLSWWCYLAISSSAAPFFSCLQSFAASGSFPVSWLFASGGQSTGASGSALVLPMNIQGWFPLELTCLISLQSKELSRIFYSPQSKASILWHSAFFMVQLSHLFMTTGKIIALTIQTFFSKMMSMFFNMLFKFVITFLLRSKHLLISWLQSSFEVILEPKKIKSVIASNFSPSLCHEVMGLSAKNLSFLNAEFQSSFFTLLFHSYQEVL